MLALQIGTSERTLDLWVDVNREERRQQRGQARDPMDTDYGQDAERQRGSVEDY